MLNYSEIDVMKKMVIILLTLFFIIGTFGQAPVPSKEYYLQKSESQKTTGWILLGGGTAMVVVGVIVAVNDNPGPYDIYGSNFETGSFLMGAGLIADLVSIPFFISSGQNARRAAKISLHRQRIEVPGQNGFSLRMQPTVTLTMGF